MTVQHQRIIHIAIAVLGPAALAFLGWGLGRYDASKLDTARFVADSVRRDVKSYTDHELLLRIDHRITDLYCGHLPADQRPGCQ